MITRGRGTSTQLSDRESRLTARGRLLVFGCGNQPAAGQQPKLVFLSRDGGRSWRKLTDPPSGGYMTLADVTRTGTIFISGPRGDVAISRDGGRTWHNSPGLSHADIADGLFATVVTSRQAYVLQDSLYFKQVFFSNDDGRTWHPVTIR